ncbi:1329_t:CDS:2, partial [Gigaspora rosea]
FTFLQVNISSTKRSYTIAFKLDVIKYAEETSNRGASLYFKVDRRRIQEWRKQKEEFETIRNKNDLSSDRMRALEGHVEEDAHSENESIYDNDGVWDYDDSNNTEPDYDCESSIEMEE